MRSRRVVPHRSARADLNTLEGDGFENDLVRKSIYDKYSGSMKTATHLDHISQCRTASGTNKSNRWTYQVLIINICRG